MKKRSTKEKKKAKDSKNYESKEDSDDINPQARKDTIWKKLFPNLKMNNSGYQIEKAICKQVEKHISKVPAVMKVVKNLSNFKESNLEAKMNKTILSFSLLFKLLKMQI